MKNSRKQQKSFVLILALIVCITVLAIGSLLPVGLSSVNSTYAQADTDNVTEIRSMLSEVSDSARLELYNEDGTMQMIPSWDNIENNTNNLINPLAGQSFNERKLLDSGKPDSESIVITIMGD